MEKYKVMDGNEACSYISYLFSELAGIYPITPASSMAEKIDELSSKKFNNLYGTSVSVIQMQSEAGAIGLVHGALLSGTIATTYTASQGLLLMIPNMYKIAGEELPCVINVAARTVATHALSILGDHSDIYAARTTGFAFLASSNVQDVMNLTAVSYLSSTKDSMPVVNFFDGFRTSHELKKIKVLDGNDLKKLIDKKSLDKFKNNSILVKNKIYGSNQSDDVFFQNAEVKNLKYDNFADTVNYYMEEINKITNKDYKPFNYYGSKTASKVIVAMGSVCDTIKEVIDNEKDLGLIEVHLYRPFSKKYFLSCMPSTVKKIAVLDRTKEPGSTGEPLYLDVCSIFQDSSIKPSIIGGRYGLSGKNTDTACIKAVYDFLDDENNFTGFTIGIEDDLTNRSLNIPDYKIKHHNTKEILIYGYGSDGMVTASKDILTIMGNYTNAFVQGYFQYDSKKSGGITKSHLRISTCDINRPYYIDKANMLVCTKDAYLLRYDVISSLKRNGTFLLVTSLNEEQVINYLPLDVKKYIIDNNINFYTIDAFDIAKSNDIPNKISSIMQAAIFKLSNLIDYNLIKEKIEKQIEKKFSKKGNDIVEANKRALNNVKINKIVLNSDSLTKKKDKILIDTEDKLIKYMFNLDGNKLKVSDFLKHEDGSFLCGISKLEKRDIASILPCWNKDNCIQCNMCALACPHAVIRPFLLTKEEVVKYNLEKKVIKAKENNDLFFYMAVSTKDCTSCSICSEVCPSKNKAIIMKNEKLIEKDSNVNDIFENVKSKSNLSKNTIKGSQYQKPLFEFSYACAGCGQTAYIKLLTQLFNNKLVIANATGCSSIYGGSIPGIPYSISWANSLFEDNAEFGLGMKKADILMKEKIKSLLINSNLSNDNRSLADNLLKNFSDENSVNHFIENFDFSEIPELENLKGYLKPKSIWVVGGDGFAYDIGYGGLDAVLSSGENINVLVLDTEVYSNTGGQKSKSTRVGANAKFAYNGNTSNKKDLARIFMSYENIYVASICLGANMNQTIKALNEAESYNGPSIVIAYAPCINHGIKSGMKSSLKEEELAVKSGYWPLFRYNALDGKLYLDYKNPDFDKYDEFINNENRYLITKKVNNENALELLKKNKENAIKRYKFYEEMSNKSV